MGRRLEAMSPLLVSVGASALLAGVGLAMVMTLGPTANASPSATSDHGRAAVSSPLPPLTIPSNGPPRSAPTDSTGSPIYCDDGPNAYTPMPADCVVPTYPGMPPIIELPSQTPWPTRTSSLPALNRWRGTEVLKLAQGVQADLIGVGPDNAARILEYSSGGSRRAFAVQSIRRDGTITPGWPAAGVPIPGNFVGEAIGKDGTVYFATAPSGASSSTPTPYTITAIGQDGKVLPGWPYTSPAAIHDLFGGLAVGPRGQVCFADYVPGRDAQNYHAPAAIYCVGHDGTLLLGWPYNSWRPLANLAFGADGTLYLKQSTQRGEGYYEIVALGVDGKAVPVWTPWPVPTLLISPIVVAPTGNVYVVVLGYDGNQVTNHLVTLGADGLVRSDRRLAFANNQNLSAMATTADGTLYVATDDEGPNSMLGQTSGHLSAFAPDGSSKPGWPAPADGPNKLYLSPDGSVWITWEISGQTQVTGRAMAVFAPNGKLRPGSPMEIPFLGNGTQIAFDSSGTAFAVASTSQSYDVVAIAP